MLQWLLDGSGLLVGSVLFDPDTGEHRSVAADDAELVPGPGGAIAVVERSAPDALTVRVVGGDRPFDATALPRDVAEGPWRLVGWVDGDVYVALTDEFVDARCWSVDPDGLHPRATCLSGSMMLAHAVWPAGDGRYVVESSGEGHPSVDLIELGDEGAQIELPWDDLYPFGPLELVPRADGTFDILTRCVLGAERPCLQDDGTGAEELPARWYRWSVGEAPRLLKVGERAERRPDPASGRVAWRRGGEVCVAGGKRLFRRCWSVPDLAG